MIKREFTVAGEYYYNQSSPVRWIISHLLRYKHLAISFMLAAILVNILFSAIPVLTGMAFNAVLAGTAAHEMLAPSYIRACWARARPFITGSASGISWHELPTI